VRTDIRVVCTQNAPKAIGKYSQAIIADNLVFTSGQIGIDPSTGKLESGIKSQTERCLKNLDAILREAGSSIQQVIRCTLYITDISRFKEINEIYSRFFDMVDPPARVTVGVATLPLGAYVEIEAIARLD
jgi:2-iminobutanoate/2-iminopropanoate deaminase